jgi:hypothetical protein
LSGKAIRFLAATIVVVATASTTTAAARPHLVTAHGIRLTVPTGWTRVQPAPAGPVVDPVTLLVVGTRHVVPKMTLCQIAAYRIPAGGAVVVIVGWKSLRNSGARNASPGRQPLSKLVHVRRPSFECFNGRGAVADLVLDRTAYQVNVLVGDRATPRVINQALAIGRSFNLSK